MLALALLLTACGASVQAETAVLVSPQAATYRPAVATAVPLPIGQWTRARGDRTAKRAPR